MDKVFGEILGSGFGSDSIMLRLVRSSMDKAHENVQAKEGSIDLLNARSKFYELAMILVEGCSELVQEKAEIPESNREKMLMDLMESRNMVRGRLEELNHGIQEKDRELVERLETEWKLRQALELKERELVHLRAKLHVEISKSERLEDEGKEGGDFCQLKNSVDQQVWSIKQKLGDERISLTSDEHLELIPTSHLSRQEQNIVIEQMSSDIDGLKGTLDVAFGKMQNVEMRPLRWKIEKEIILILIEGFMGNLKHEFEQELENRSKQESFGFLNKHWLELISEITTLHQELEPLCSLKENEVKRVEDDNIFLRRTSSEPPPEVFDYVKEPPQVEEEEGGGGGSNYVAKMVKNHESIIRKHQQELNKLKREILRENESLSVRRLKGPNNLATRIHEVTARLNNIIRWNSKIGDLNSVCQERKYMRMSSFRDSKREFAYHDEIKKLKQERHDLELQITMLQEAYAILFEGLAKDFCYEMSDHEAQSVIRDDVLTHFLREMIHEWNSNNQIEEMHQMSEEMLLIIFREMIEEYRNKIEEMHKFYIDQEVAAREIILENELKEEIETIYLRDAMKQWKIETEAIEFETLIREDINKILLVESVRECEVSYQENCKKNEVQVLEENRISEEMLLIIFQEMIVEYRNKIEEMYQICVDQEVVAREIIINNELKEEIQTIYLRDAMKQWKIETEANEFETLIREDLYKILLVESVRECEVSYDQENCKKNEIQVLDSLLKCLEAEEDLIHSASCEIKEHKKDNGMVASECEEIDERDAIEWLLTEEDSTFSSVGNKLEKALQLLVITKALLKEMQESVSSSITAAQESETLCLLQKEKHIRRMKPSDGMLFLFMGFDQLIGGFEGVVLQKLNLHFPRLEEMSRQMHKLSQSVESLRKRELLYKQAFTIRCHNLKLAETEVDLLGDQVDVLQDLLGKIYLILEQHSPDLSRYFKVSDILELIKKVLAV